MATPPSNSPAAPKAHPDLGSLEEPESDENGAMGELTIDELAAHTGVPTRTIRFYQAKGVLPAPARRGRIALYRPHHIDRLRLVGNLQDRGLRLKAIQDLLKRSEREGLSIDEWLGIRDKLVSWAEDAPRTLSESELQEMLGERPPGTVARLVRLNVIHAEGPAGAPPWGVPSPALLGLALQLEDAGIDIEVAVEVHAMLQKRLARAADDVVHFLFSRVGKGFGRSTQAEDVQEAVEAIRKRGIDAVRIIFGREIDRAVGELLQQDPSRRWRGR